ncbi:hypothetical protein [Pelomonas sp. Root1444]|uniref:hypothetical protein n=1 Tax=Pelomonas sp. Root1444 TaxID=1736464 RepID=UPI0007028EF1|nr:hypothetical protein [Pelomonas sp. Root1444]KQY81365.1 hypothetical protein ASD35_05950 [Pelomonas sp. Root1444]
MTAKNAFVAATLAVASLGAFAQLQPVDTADPVAPLVNQLDLDKYKATIKGLTQFGDRRQGTARNRAALDWIEAQLKRYGCTNTERLRYDFTEPAKRGPVQLQPLRAGGPAAQAAARCSAGARPSA